MEVQVLDRQFLTGTLEGRSGVRFEPKESLGKVRPLSAPFSAILAIRSVHQKQTLPADTPAHRVCDQKRTASGVELGS